MKKQSPCTNCTRLLLLSIITAFFAFPHCGNGENNEIAVYCNKELGEVNKKVFGNNFIAYDPATYEDWPQDYYGYSDYGSGVWDAKNNRSVKETVDLAIQAGMSVIRFPGGCGAHRYNWKNAIGEKRSHFLFGIDEFMRTAQAIGAEAVFTVSYFSGNVQDAADLVEYLNSPDDGNHRWAKERAKNGHPAAYGVKYFEIGNEDWHGDHRQVKAVSPGDYGQRYLKYYAAMKAVDPAIKIGVILCCPQWDQEVLEAVKGSVDFGIMHIYPAARTKILEVIDRNPYDIFQEALTQGISQCENNIQHTLHLLEEKAGMPVPVAITEYNGGFNQDNPVPYRHCLGTALLNAEFLRIVMKPQNNVLMANYWQFANSYWGMIYSKNDFTSHDYRLPLDYVKRPNYYVYELYHNHFGDILVEAAQSNPYLAVNSSKSKDGKKIYLMVINKDLKSAINATIVLNDFSCSQGNSWVLNAARIDAVNEKDSDNVKVTQKELRAKGNTFEVTFPAHSLTAIAIEGKQ